MRKLLEKPSKCCIQIDTLGFLIEILLVQQYSNPLNDI